MEYEEEVAEWRDTLQQYDEQRLNGVDIVPRNGDLGRYICVSVNTADGGQRVHSECYDVDLHTFTKLYSGVVAAADDVYQSVRVGVEPVVTW